MEQLLLDILIHTSVKLVTTLEGGHVVCPGILIHTSVKLVTSRRFNGRETCLYFNPHEREARDDTGLALTRFFQRILIHTSVKLVT